AFPHPLFRYVASLDNITVHSDEPIPAEVAGVLDIARQRLAASPLNDPTLRHHVFICNRSWLFPLLTNRNWGAGGLNVALLNRNIFLRRSDIARNRMFGRSGREVPDERTLAYFIAHEITHSLEVQFLGRIAYARLPVWKREGYADYVARPAEQFRFSERLT